VRWRAVWAWSCRWSTRHSFIHAGNRDHEWWTGHARGSRVGWHVTNDPMRLLGFVNGDSIPWVCTYGYQCTRPLPALCESYYAVVRYGWCIPYLMTTYGYVWLRMATYGGDQHVARNDVRSQPKSHLTWWNNHSGPYPSGSVRTAPHMQSIASSGRWLMTKPQPGFDHNQLLLFQPRPLLPSIHNN
jgi:hypothetical protein